VLLRQQSKLTRKISRSVYLCMCMCLVSRRIQGGPQNRTVNSVRRDLSKTLAINRQFGIPLATTVRNISAENYSNILFRSNAIGSFFVHTNVIQ